MSLRWRNYTDLPDQELRRLYAAVRPANLPAHDCMVLDCLTGIGFGSAYVRGPKRIVVAVPRSDWAARRRRRGGFLSRSRMETFVRILAHELRHLWQATHRRPCREADADAYAWQMVQRYRKGTL